MKNPVICDECGQDAITRPALKMHMQVKHTMSDLQKPVEEEVKDSEVMVETKPEKEIGKLVPVNSNHELSLQEKVDIETGNRRILTEFISKHMVRGQDFGGIMMGGRMSKDSLFKPGAEKIASLLQLRADVVKDSDTWEMAGNKQGLFCYRCNLYNRSNDIVGMGLGACSIEEKKNANNAIKIAKKRAFVDAVLTTGALSDFFTQDLEDMIDSSGEKNGNSYHYQSPQKSMYQQARENSYPELGYKDNFIPKEPTMITSDQQGSIRQLMVKKGKSMEDIEAAITGTQWNGHSKTKLEELTEVEANTLIKRMDQLPDKK